jgi:hypothetical protein
VSSQTASAPAAEDRRLEQLEAEFLRAPDLWASSTETDLVEMLAPVVGPVNDSAGRTMSKKKTGRYCCDV